VPRQAITLGMGTILKSKEIVLIANGESKAHVMKQLMNARQLTRFFRHLFCYCIPMSPLSVTEAASLIPSSEVTP
jgi:glucosamine-6-phosphate deaminase